MAVVHGMGRRRARHVMVAFRIVIRTAISVVVAMWVALADAVPAIPGEAAIFSTAWPVGLICATFSQS